MASNKGRLSSDGLLGSDVVSPPKKRLSIAATPRKSVPSYLNLSGPAKSGFRLALDYASNVHKWNEAHGEGVSYSYTLRGKFARELDKYPEAFDRFANTFEKILKDMNSALECIKTISGQYSSLAKLMPSDEPLFNTWSIKKLSKEMEKISIMINDETNVKRIIKENILHIVEDTMLEVYISAWEYNTQMNKFTLDSFLTELSFDKNK